MADMSPTRLVLRIAACVAALPALAALPARADTDGQTRIAFAATRPHTGSSNASAGPYLPEGAGDGGVSIIRPPTHPSVAAIVPAAGTTCESAVVLKGRGFMYGIARGETPVLDHPHCRQ
ncbi:hypothetical protein M1D80_21075 [Phyllobacteriaceae bacterium JZ32]